MSDDIPSGARAARARGERPDGTSAAGDTTRASKPRGGHRRGRRARGSGRNRGKSASKSYAALDLGTNNCRLLIAKPTPNDPDQAFRVVDSFSQVVKLGDGLVETGRLSERAMDAAVRAIGICAQKMADKSVFRARCVATQACRQAENGRDFIQRVKAETGVGLDMISPRVEARLAVMGCLNLIDRSKDVVMVVDIGGGSTELSWVDVRKLRGGQGSLQRPPISAWASLPVGVVTLTDRVGETDTPYEDMCALVTKTIVEQGCEHRFTKAFRKGRGHIIGTSGTITSLAGVHLKLPYYQRHKIDGMWMPGQSTIDLARDMGTRDEVGRAAEPSIGEDRAKLLAAGCAIVDVLCSRWPAERVRVADRGLREGMLLGLIHNKAFR